MMMPVYLILIDTDAQGLKGPEKPEDDQKKDSP